MAEPLTIHCWQLRVPSEPLVGTSYRAPALEPDQVLVRVAGCGVCHTDLGYIFDGVKPRHALPLTLGHEIAGVVERAGAGHHQLAGKSVVVPAVIPCGACELCAGGSGMICRAQIFPGCDVHGGFASHVVVPGAGLCVVDEAALAASRVELAELAVVGDAVSTAYQAIVRSELGANQLALVVGAGGVGSFAVQIAAARGAHVIALDIDDGRLARCAELGAAHTINVKDVDARTARSLVRDYVRQAGLPDTQWRIYECSGNAAGQALAFNLLTFGAVLAVVGYTLDTVDVRLSNLMAFDARAIGNWGCLPAHYPAVVSLVLDGTIAIGPLVERHPMSQVNEVIGALHAGRMSRRPVLLPDFEVDR